MIRCNFFFLSFGREPTERGLHITTYKYWSAHAQCRPTVFGCKQYSAHAQKETVFFSFLRSLLRENGRSLRFPRIFIKKNKLGDRMIKQLLNSVMAKYRDLSVSLRSIICLSLRLRQIIDLFATDKSRYFAQPPPIIVNYLPPTPPPPPLP